jgi:disulfide bond formation protein DsbB
MQYREEIYSNNREVASMFYSRWTSFVGLCICLGLLGFAAYLQEHLGLLPCPLCVLQRIFVALLGIVFLVGSLYTPNEKLGQRIHSGFIIAFSLMGGLAAARHVWLTHQPPGTVSSCSPTLEYMLQNLPFMQAVKLLLTGSGDCARVTYRLMDLSIPEWTLLFFMALLVFGIIRFMRARSTIGL